jgi:two-component system, cell cycle sensor histidine kinase and response regulator CckA
MGESTRDGEGGSYLLRAILESPPNIIIFALDREYRYLAFNENHRRTMKAIWGVDIEVEQNMLDIIQRDDDRARAKQNFDRALAGEHFVLEEAYGEEAISRRSYENVYSPIVGAEGEVVGLTVFLTDVTAQRAVQQELEQYRGHLEELVRERTAALERSEALYRTLVGHAPVGVVVHRKGGVLYANERALAIAGDGDAAALRRSVHEALGVPDAQPSVATPETVEVSLRRADGSVREVEWSSLPVDVEGGPAVLSLAVDISERKRREAERRLLEEQMRETQKLESLGLLAGGIAHDFNNLLVGILGNVDLALRGAAQNPTERLQLERAKTAALRASELTAQLLAYSGKRAFSVRTVDLNALTEEMADLLSVTVPKGVLFEVRLGKVLPMVEGDAVQLRQVVMNLVTNAADAVGEAAPRGGGRITLRTSIVGADVIGQAAAERPATDYVRLEVSDNGVGMAEGVQKRMFDPFFTTKAKGRGLGLAAVVGIVRSHGGILRVESAPGRGTTVVVFLPMSHDQAEEAPPAPAEEEWRPSGTVLVADDEARVRQVLVMMLTDLGLDVLEASDTASCLETYRAHADAVNAIIVDLTMPGGGGREVVRALRAEGHQIPIVVSSGYSEDVIQAELRRDAHLRFLEKPFELTTFIDTLRAAMETDESRARAGAS